MRLLEASPPDADVAEKIPDGQLDHETNGYDEEQNAGHIVDHHDDPLICRHLPVIDGSKRKQERSCAVNRVAKKSILGPLWQDRGEKGSSINHQVIR